MSEPNRPSVQAIQQAVAARFSMPFEMMRGKCRKRAYAAPRQMAMVLSRDLTGLSLTRIGMLFDRDHTTVLHAMKTVQKKFQTTSDARRIFEELRTEILFADDWRAKLRPEVQACMAIGLALHGFQIVPEPMLEAA